MVFQKEQNHVAATCLEPFEPRKPDWLTQMESVLGMLNEGVVIVNRRHQILFANSRFLEITGIPRENLIGNDPSQFYSTRELEFLEAQWKVAFETGYNNYSFVLPQKNGGRLPVIISSRTFEIDQDSYRVLTFTDISEQVRIEADLRAANLALEERQKEIEEDLRLAEQVQNSLAPKTMTFGNLSVDSFYRPARSIGGDFVLVAPSGHVDLNLLVGDVSGHGVGSALIANRIYSKVAGHLRSGLPFLDLFWRLNRFLMDVLHNSSIYLTAAAARIDTHRRSMVFAGAGHPPAIVIRRGQDPVLLESKSKILGMLPEAVDTEPDVEIELQPDDRVLLYTDGLTEVFDSQGRMLGLDGFLEIVRRASTLSATDMKRSIMDDVAAWRSGPPTDDASLVVAHVQ